MSAGDKSMIEVRKSGAGFDTAYVGKSRVRVSDIARMYALAQDELIVERIHEWVPTLSKEQIHAALEYWREHPAEVQAVIDRDSEALEKIPYAG